MAENAILRHQTLTVLQQIEELKNWHKQQQAKLSPDSITPEKSDSSERIYERYQNKNDKNMQSKKNQQVDPIPQENFDEVPIRVANPNFHNLIENNISPNEGRPDETQQNGEKPKFKFLKRGEGIARFRMGPPKIRKSVNNNKRTLNLTNNTKKSHEDYQNPTDTGKQLVCKKDGVEEKEETLLLNPPDLKLDFKDWKGIFNSGKAEEFIERAIENNRLELFQPNSSIDSSTASIMEKLLTIGRKHLKEREELRVFETMEQHILNSSFSSTSSYVSKLMENAVISTPVKKSTYNYNTQQSQSNYKPNDGQMSTQENAVQKNLEIKPEAPKWINPETTNGSDYKLQSATNEEDSEHSLHVRFAEEIDYKSFVEYSQSFNNSNQKETSGGKRFDDSEEWKEYTGDDSSCCSQCSTTYSSSDEDARAISPPVKPPPTVKSHQSDHSSNKGEAQSSKNQIPTERLNIDDLRSVNTQSTEHKNDSKCTMDMFPPILGAKLKELEDEIEIFRAENNKVKALRESLEKEHKLLQQEKKKLFKEIEEEKKKNTAIIEEEKQKLAKEKFIFEKYSKTLTKNPTKEERKEIQGLREQLNEMKGELNKKESRWAAAQARVRNQVKLLENDNKKLKEEVETLRKQAKNLEFLTQKKKSKSYNNTKLIHAINDYISNVPVDNDKELKKGPEEGGYFNQKSNLVKTVIVHDSDPKGLSAIKVIKENGPENISSRVHADRSDKPGQATRNESGECEQPLRVGNVSPLSEQTSQERETNLRSKSGEPSEERHLYNLNSAENSQRGFVQERLENSPREIINEDGNMEKVFPDGRKEIRYKNGNIKKIDPFTGNEKTIYYNGDVKEITRDGTLKYYFSEKRTWQTTLPDGLVVLDFPNGQVEKRHIDGMVEVIYPNNNKKLTYRDGSEEIYYADGTVEKIEANKRKVISLPNGQKEIHTDECIRREYPDGTVKICYPDGTIETVYSDGRVRLKDKHGNLVMDSGPAVSNKL